MNKAIYVATTKENSGKSIITLGLMSMLIGKTAKVGYFRPWNGNFSLWFRHSISRCICDNKKQVIQEKEQRKTGWSNWFDYWKI